MEQAVTRKSNRTIYGYERNDAGQICINAKQSKIIKTIFSKYLEGYSLGSLSVWLASTGIPSPTGKESWGRASLDKLLSNQSYVPLIISSNQYEKVQQEKKQRSNIEIDGTESRRKSVRYNSTNVLSGLLVCDECGSNYRRITRPDGHIVWRCANRVEHGKAICKHSPTIDENDVLKMLQQRFGDLTISNPGYARQRIGSIRIPTELSIRID